MTQRSLILTLTCCAAAATALAAAAATPALPPGAAGFDARHAERGDHAGRRPLRTVQLDGTASTAPRGGGVPAAWSALGPYGGDVTSVAASPTQPDLVFAGTAPGGAGGGTLYRSTDGAAHWSAVPALAFRSVFDIAFASTGTVFVGTDGGVFSSSDGGASWTQRDMGIGANQLTTAIAVDPGNPSTIWAGVDDAFGTQAANVVRSTDGGATWTNVTPARPTPMSATAIAIHPADPQIVIATFGGWMGGGEVWVTTNGGSSWTNRSAGLPANPIRAVQYDGIRLLVGGGQMFGSQFVGLYASTDLGQTWTALHDAGWPLRVVTDIAVDPTDPQTILAAIDGGGINRTTDGGATWETGIGGSTILSAQSVRYAPGNPDVILVGASSLGVYRSADGGDAFAASTIGIAELPLMAVDTSPAEPDHVAVAFQGNNNGGILTSTDGGATWTAEPVPPTRYSNVRYAPDGTLFALSSGPSSVAPEGLYRRNGDGSWTSLGPDQGTLFESDLVAIRFGATASTIYLGGADFGVAGSERTVWRSTDGGTTWTKTHEGTDGDKVVDIEIVAGSGNQRLIATYDGPEGGALRSADGGVAWSAAVTGLPGFARFGRLCSSPAAPGTTYMSMWDTWGTGAVYRSSDDGASWTSTGWSGGNLSDIACHPQEAGVLYAAQQSATAVIRSTDGGASFAAFASGLDAAGSPTELALSRAGEPRLYLSTTRGSFVTPRDGAADPIFADGFD